MQTVKLGMAGATPAVLVKPLNPEQAKYEKLWKEFSDYRKFSPAEAAVQPFLLQAKPKPDDKVLDIGCGTGRASLLLALFGRVKVTMVDFVEDALDEDVKNALTTQAHALDFKWADIEKEIPVMGDYAFCVDVMEHIPTDKVNDVLRNILGSARHCFFQISTVDDHFGQLIGEKLHLTVRPKEWWMKKLTMLGFALHWAADLGHAVQFYGTAWTARALVDRGAVNTNHDQILANVRSACKRGLQQAQPYGRQETEIMIVGGGPSLEKFWPMIIEKRNKGMPLVTINGTYNEAIKQGLKPSAQIIVDAREFNTRFVTPIVEKCKYLIASQVHPSVFDAIPKEQTTLWHSVIGDVDIMSVLDEELGAQNWFPVPGGSTAMLRSFCLLRMLGFYKFHVFGFDSCLSDDNKHHAYDQKENDMETVIDIEVPISGRKFKCHPWMASQAQEFIEQTKMMGDEIQMIVYGDGLIHHILETGASEVDVEKTDVPAPPGICTI